MSTYQSYEQIFDALDGNGPFRAVPASWLLCPRYGHTDQHRLKLLEEIRDRQLWVVAQAGFCSATVESDWQQKKKKPWTPGMFYFKPCGQGMNKAVQFSARETSGFFCCPAGLETRCGGAENSTRWWWPRFSRTSFSPT